jgi:hypothetical protein
MPLRNKIDCSCDHILDEMQNGIVQTRDKNTFGRRIEKGDH